MDRLPPGKFLGNFQDYGLEVSPFRYGQNRPGRPLLWVTFPLSTAELKQRKLGNRVLRSISARKGKSILFPGPRRTMYLFACHLESI